MPGTALCGHDVFVRQAKKLRDILDAMRGELFQHLLIPYTLAKCDYNRSIENMRNCAANLREPLDEGAQRFPRTLSHGVEVGLIVRPPGGGCGATGHVAIPKPRRVVVLVPRSRGDVRAFLRRGWAWSHEECGLVATLEPSPAG
jgi:hypothetical protein